MDQSLSNRVGNSWDLIRDSENSVHNNNNNKKKMGQKIYKPEHVENYKDDEEEEEEDDHGSYGDVDDDDDDDTSDKHSQTEPTKTNNNNNNNNNKPIPWIDMYEQLKAYYDTHGHTKIKLKRGKNDRFVTWVRNQKTILGKAKRQHPSSLSSTTLERIAKLDAIDFEWPKSSSSLSSSSADVGNSKPKKSSLNVITTLKSSIPPPNSLSYTHHNGLSQLSNAPYSGPTTNEQEQQRDYYHHHHRDDDDSEHEQENEHDGCEDPTFNQTMDDPRYQIVTSSSSGTTSLPSNSSSSNTTWDFFYGRLVQFYQQHGHTKVKLIKGENDKFVNWIRNQKTFLGKFRRRQRRIPSPSSPQHPDSIKTLRIAKLDAIEFDWPKPSPHEANSPGEAFPYDGPEDDVEKTPNDNNSNSKRKALPTNPEKGLKKAKKKKMAGATTTNMDNLGLSLFPGSNVPDSTDNNMNDNHSSQVNEPSPSPSSSFSNMKLITNASSEDSHHPVMDDNHPVKDHKRNDSDQNPEGPSVAANPSPPNYPVETFGLDEQDAARALLRLVGVW